ncbi:MAG TPA: hypothetical protein DIW30_07320 [Bacteroidales bacterium]|nr:hypothetical protein [Bacteroidales bacterium]
MTKFYSKSELAAMAGVSAKTFQRAIAGNERILRTMKQMNISKSAKLLPPRIVKVINEELVLGIKEME